MTDLSQETMTHEEVQVSQEAEMRDVHEIRIHVLIQMIQETEMTDVREMRIHVQDHHLLRLQKTINLLQNPLQEDLLIISL